MKVSEHGGPVVVVDDSQTDLALVRLCYERSSVPNTLLALGSPQHFLTHMQDVKRGLNEMPAVVLIDVNMPGMTGHDAVASLLADGSFQEAPRIYMFTHSDSPRDVERARKTGAFGVLVKPHTVQGLIDLFENLEI